MAQVYDKDVHSSEYSHPTRDHGGLRMTKPPSVFDKQFGGGHYKDFAIQPAEYIRKNNLGWYEGNVVKYISRYNKKGGLLDLEKARHYLEMIFEELERG